MLCKTWLVVNRTLLHSVNQISAEEFQLHATEMIYAANLKPRKVMVIACLSILLVVGLIICQIGSRVKLSPNQGIDVWHQHKNLCSHPEGKGTPLPLAHTRTSTFLLPTGYPTIIIKSFVRTAFLAMFALQVDFRSTMLKSTINKTNWVFLGCHGHNPDAIDNRVPTPRVFGILSSWR